MLTALRTEVYEANLEIVRRGLVLYTFGNASGIARDHGLRSSSSPVAFPTKRCRPPIW